jgi:CIC family chloride channel protein
LLMDGNNVANSKPLNPLSFSLLSVLIGVAAGLGAVAFRALIALFHNLLFLGKLSVVYDAEIHTPASPWGPFVILAPVLGALCVAFLVKNLAVEAKGSGIPEVIDAIYYNKGIIRPVVAVVRPLSSALSIGSGAAVGREGPIIQIGASFASTVGQILRMPVWQRITLIAAGAGGGVAATFNAPIGGVLFAVEIMLTEVSARTLIPLTIAAATATYVGQIFFGPHPFLVIPRFETPSFQITGPLVLFTYVALGIITGLVSVAYIKSVYGFQDFFEKRLGANYYIRHMIGMFPVGIIMYLLMVTLGHYYVEGVGYSTVHDVLSGTLSQAYLLLLLFLLKLLTTSLSLGSGASGGVFSPALFMGATLGGAYGIVAGLLFPTLPISPPALAVAGMAGMVGGTTGAAMAAIVMIFEMTLDYNVIVPMTITVALSYGVRRMFSIESIYTRNLARFGHYVPEALHTNFQQIRRAKDVMDTRMVIVPASATLGKFARIALEQTAVSWFLVEDSNRVVGVVTKEAALGALTQHGETLTLGEVANRDYVTVAEEASLFDVIARLHSNHASIALVTCSQEAVSAGDVKGLITKHHIGDSMAQAIELFSDT